MKKLMFINGTMGAGKTATCEELLKLLKHSVFLDGDWCWNMNPHIVTEETKKMVESNISFMLNSFIKCSEYKYILFCWVMDRQEIMDNILKRLKLDSVEVHTFTLTLTEDALTKRLEADISNGIREPDIIERSIPRIKQYDNMNTIKIDVSNITALQAANKIINYIK